MQCTPVSTIQTHVHNQIQLHVPESAFCRIRFAVLDWRGKIFIFYWKFPQGTNYFVLKKKKTSADSTVTDRVTLHDVFSWIYAASSDQQQDMFPFGMKISNSSLIDRLLIQKWILTATGVRLFRMDIVAYESPT